MTPVSALAPAEVWSWSPFVPVLAALAGGFMAVAGGVVAAYVTQHLTRFREDRARIIQQRREVMVGALSAYREYVELKLEAVAATTEFSTTAKVHADARKMVDQYLHPQGLMMAKVESEAARKSEEVVAELQERLKTAGENASAKERAKIIAHTSLAYWSMMLDVTCASKVGNAYRALVNAPDGEKLAAQKDYVEAMQGELVREPELPGLMVALIGESRRRVDTAG